MTLILAISGPAAVGKTTICDRLIADFGGSMRRLIQQLQESQESLKKMELIITF
jgi:uridine kinase